MKNVWTLFLNCARKDYYRNYIESSRLFLLFTALFLLFSKVNNIVYDTAVINILPSIHYPVSNVTMTAIISNF